MIPKKTKTKNQFFFIYLYLFILKKKIIKKRKKKKIKKKKGRFKWNIQIHYNKICTLHFKGIIKYKRMEWTIFKE